jgi:ADP-heptose:LPS heptosyltransferase
MLPSKILIFSHDNKIGDAILLTSLLAPIKKKWPHCQIDIFCGKDNAPIWQYHNAVNRIYVLPSRSILVRALYGLMIRMQPPTFAIISNGECQGKSFWLLKKIANIKKIFWLSTEKNAHSKDILIFGDWNSGHYLLRCEALINAVSGEKSAAKVDFVLSQSAEDFASDYWTRLRVKGARKIIINSAGSSSDRSFSFQKINEFCDGLGRNLSNIQIFIISYNKKHESFLRGQFDNSRLVNVIPARKNILDIAALIKTSDLLITPDTSAVHISSAFDKKVVGIYTSEQAAINWGPLSRDAKTLFAKMSVENISAEDVIAAAVNLLN